MNPRDDYFETLMRAAVPEIRYDFDKVNRATEGTLSGEKRLLIVLLRDAVEIIQGRRMPGMYGEKKHRSNPKREAINWMLDDDESYALSFVAVCDYLGLNPEAVRAEVLRKRKDAA